MTRIGVHPNNTSLYVLSHRGTLADATWVAVPGAETPAAIHEGRIDLTGTGSTPPLTALALGADVVYLAISEPRPEHGSLIVRADSDIADLGDLRGRRIGLGIGSYQSTLLVEALDRVGLGWADVEAVSGLGRRGAEAFESGELDAWIGNDPHLADVQSRVATRELVATGELISNRSVWFARRALVEDDPVAVRAALEALQAIDAWIAAEPRAAAELLAREVEGDNGLGPVESWERALRRRPWGLHPVDEGFVAEQQRAADLLHRNGQLPGEVRVADAVVPALAEQVAALAPLATAGSR